MLQEDVTDLLDRVAADEDLRLALRSAGSAAELIAVAHTHGLNFRAPSPPDVLTDSELDGWPMAATDRTCHGTTDCCQTNRTCFGTTDCCH